MDWKPIRELRSVTCHMRSQSVTLQPEIGWTRPAMQAGRLFDLPTPEGWKAELTLVIGHIPRWFTCPQTVTHPSSNHSITTRPEDKCTIFRSWVQRPNRYATKPPVICTLYRQGQYQEITQSINQSWLSSRATGTSRLIVNWEILSLICSGWFWCDWWWLQGMIFWSARRCWHTVTEHDEAVHRVADAAYFKRSMPTLRSGVNDLLITFSLKLILIPE